jgi:hypothetical protein
MIVRDVGTISVGYVDLLPGANPGSFGCNNHFEPLASMENILHTNDVNIKTEYTHKSNFFRRDEIVTNLRYTGLSPMRSRIRLMIAGI